MSEQRLNSFSTYPYVEESLTALEFAYQIRDFDVLRGKLEEWFPRPGPGMRKRVVREIIRRFIRYENNLFRGYLKNLEQLIQNALDEICKRPQPIEQNGFTGEDFENAIGTLLSEVGYKKIEGTQKTRDGGIDFFLHHSIPLSGEYRIGVQCKKEKVASRKKPGDFTKFIGALTQHECREGFWMTTAPESKFDDDALRKSSPPIRLFAKSKIINLLNTHKCTKFRFY